MTSLVALDQNAPATPRYVAMLEEDRAKWWQSENWDKWAAHYVSEYPRGQFILEMLSRYVPAFTPEEVSVLDVGCGDAGVLIAFAERGAAATGIDPDPRSVKRGMVRAEEHAVHIDLRRATAEALPFDDASFDLVILDNVLEHVADRDQTLSEIHRVLHPGGLLYMVTPKPFAVYSLVSDPHYSMAGLVLLPRSLQVLYFERVRGGGVGNYGVGRIPTRRYALKMLRRHGFTSLVAPRELWTNYLRAKIARPEQVSAGLKRRLAEWVKSHPASVDHPAARFLFDISVGANMFIGRRL